MPLPFGKFSKTDETRFTPEDGRQALIGENSEMAAIMPPYPTDGSIASLSDISQAELSTINAAALSVVTAAFAGSLGGPIDRAKAEYLIGMVYNKIPDRLIPALMLAITRTTVDLTGGNVPGDDD